MRNRAAFLDAYFSKGGAPRGSSREGGAVSTQEGAPVTDSSLPSTSEGKAVIGDDTGGMFVAGELDVSLGEECDVELVFQEEHVRFHIRAVVKWKRTQVGRRSLPPGVGLEFLPSEKRTQDQIMRFAEGKESVSHVDRPRRWSLAVDVKVTDQTSRTIAGVTDDISEGGCFVITDAPLVIGRPVEVKLKAPGSLFGWLTIEGVVTWRREQPGRSGVGIELKFGNERQRRAMQRILEVVKARTLREVRVKVPRVTTPPTQQ